MALIKCGECGREVSDKAVNCPHCGCPISDTMSGWISAAVTYVFNIAIGSGYALNSLVTGYMSGVLDAIKKEPNYARLKDVKYGDIIRQPLWFEQRVTIIMDCAANPPYTNVNIWFKPRFGGGYSVEEKTF